MNIWLPGTPFPSTFHQVARSVYQEDPLWIPESASALSVAFSQKNSYFNSSSAKAWHIEDTARLAGFYDPKQQIEGQQVAYFGFWETKNDLDANQRLFAEFEEWALSKGATYLYGPINFNTYQSYRIRLNLKEDEGCFYGEPYHPLYYQSLLEALGYQIEQKYVSHVIPTSEFDTVYAAKDFMMKELEKSPFHYQALTPEYWLSRLPDFYEVADLIFRQNFAYSPVSYEAFVSQYGQAVANKFCPHLSIVVLDEQDQIAAFFLGYPDYAELICQGSPHALHWADMDYETHFPLLSSPRLLIKTAGVHPRYRRQNVLGHMIAFGMLSFRDHYQEVIATLMREDNFTTRAFGQFQVQERWYGLWGKKIS